MDDRRPRVYLVDPSGQRRPRELAEGVCADLVGIGSLAWHPSGDRILFLGQRYRAGSPTRLEDVVYEVGPESGEVRTVHRDGGWGAVVYAGDAPAAVGAPELFLWPEPASLWSLADPENPVDLLPGLDRSIEGVQRRGERLFFLVEEGGEKHLVRWTAGEEPVRVLDPVPFVSAFDASPENGSVAWVATGPTDPGELYRSDGTGAEKLAELDPLTRLNEDFRNEAETVTPVRFPVEVDGVSIDAWVYLPPGEGVVPVLLNIHGGPATQYGCGFFDEFQVYTGAGYAVVACNPRGSSGRGKDYLRAVRKKAWGEVDRRDILACLDAALERFDRLDTERIGVMGGSYGGFMTAWLIAHTDRFVSAVVERGLLDWATFSGNSDIGAIFSRMYLDVGPRERELQTAKSPFTWVDRVHTPTLIIHSEQDYRCPIDQAERYFAALLENGVEAEFLRFPGESHELSRSGDPKHREARFRAILEWHGRFLKPREADDRGPAPLVASKDPV